MGHRTPILAENSTRCRQLRKQALELNVENFTAALVRAFLDYLEKERGNSTRTRNARLAILHTFFQYLASLDPRFMEQCQAVCGIPFKRREEPVLDYLERQEVLILAVGVKDRNRLIVGGEEVEL